MTPNKFTMDKKLVVQVRYYETMFVITDNEGERVYTGNNEKTARSILSMLNGYHARKLRKKPRGKRKR